MKNKKIKKARDDNIQNNNKKHRHRNGDNTNMGNRRHGNGRSNKTILQFNKKRDNI